MLTQHRTSRPQAAFLSLPLLALAFSAAASADTAVLVADRDAVLYESGTGNLANGSGVYLFAGNTLSFGLRRSALFFDVAASIPAGSTIQSVTLDLFVSNRPNATPVSLELRTASQDWGEGASDPGGPEGAGTAPQAGDTTWLHTFFPGTNWTTAGGDFAATASATTVTSGLNVLASFTSTAQLVTDVQSWVDAPAGNFGWILLGDETTTQTARRFDSRDTLNPPTLTVEFDPAVVATPTEIPTLDQAALAILALLIALVAMTRRK